MRKRVSYKQLERFGHHTATPVLFTKPCQKMNDQYPLNIRAHSNVQ